MAWPIIFRKAGRTNNSNPTNELTGLPGSPNTSRSSAAAEQQRLARFQPHLVEVATTPMPVNTSGTRSNLPAETPAGQHQHVGRVEPLGDESSQAIVVVAGDAEVLHGGPGPARQRY